MADRVPDGLKEGEHKKKACFGAHIRNFRVGVRSTFCKLRGDNGVQNFPQNTMRSESISSHH